MSDAADLAWQQLSTADREHCDMLVEHSVMRVEHWIKNLDTRFYPSLI